MMQFSMSLIKSLLELLSISDYSTECLARIHDAKKELVQSSATGKESSILELNTNGTLPPLTGRRVRSNAAVESHGCDRRKDHKGRHKQKDFSLRCVQLCASF